MPNELFDGHAEFVLKAAQKMAAERAALEAESHGDLVKRVLDQRNRLRDLERKTAEMRRITTALQQKAGVAGHERMFAVEALERACRKVSYSVHYVWGGKLAIQGGRHDDFHDGIVAMRSAMLSLQRWFDGKEPVSIAHAARDDEGGAGAAGGGGA